MGFCAVGDAGGIFALSRLAVEHRGPLTADFRTIYSLSLQDARGSELWLLIRSLISNPTSSFHAAMAGWTHPLSFEGMAQLDMYDLLYQSWPRRGRFKPYKRPWPDKSTKKLGGSNTRRSIAEVRKILRPDS